MKSKGVILKNPVIYLFLIITLCCTFILFISVLKLPEIKSNNTLIVARVPNIIQNERIGKLGEMIIEMLPIDLGFTIFLPTEKAFIRDLKLQWNDSSLVNENDDTYATLTRIMGFSAVPRMIYSDDLMNDNEINYDSLSGYVLYVWKDFLNGGLVVNQVRSEEMDLKIGKIVVHLMDGVIMDAEFEQSVRFDDDSDQD